MLCLVGKIHSALWSFLYLLANLLWLKQNSTLPLPCGTGAEQALNILSTTGDFGCQQKHPGHKMISFSVPMEKEPCTALPSPPTEQSTYENAALSRWSLATDKQLHNFVALMSTEAVRTLLLTLRSQITALLQCLLAALSYVSRSFRKMLREVGLCF